MNNPTSGTVTMSWQPLIGPGHIQQGDWLSFTVAGKHFCAQAKLIIDSGSEREEVVYNRNKNHYFVTAMAIDGTSTHKGVMVACAQPAEQLVADASVTARNERYRNGELDSVVVEITALGRFPELQVGDALYRHPPTPAVQAAGENASFEKWRNDQIASLERMGYPDAATAFRNLGSVHWAGWQGRAALAAPVQPNCKFCGDTGTIHGSPCGGCVDAPVQSEQEPVRMVVEVMQFQMKHPSSGETHIVEFSRAEVADGMEDTLYEKLGDLVCDCNGEADHECGDYIHDFDLRPAIPGAAAQAVKRTEEQERAEFESWVTGRKVVRRYGAKLTLRSDGSYADYRINDRWLAWKARAALETRAVRMPAEKAVTRAWGHDMGGNYEEGRAFGFNEARDAVSKLNGIEP